MGLIRQDMKPDSENIIKNLNTTSDIRKVFLKHEELQKDNSLKIPKVLMEKVLSRLSLKDKQFQIFTPASEENITNLKEVFKCSIQISTC